MEESGSVERPIPPSAPDGLGEATLRPTPTVDNTGVGAGGSLAEVQTSVAEDHGEEVPVVIEDEVGRGGSSA